MAMRKPNNKTIYWILQIASFLLSAGIPAIVVWQKFPLFVEKAGKANSVGIGLVLIIVIACVTFRKTIFATIKKALGITSVPPIVGWAVALVVLFALSKLVSILADLQVICFAGLTGSALGMACSLISQIVYPDSKKQEDLNNGDTKT